MNQTIKTFSDNPAVASAFARDLVSMIASIGASGGDVNIALSGGSTPKLLFEILASQFADQIDWKQVHFFWGDERCVEPDSPESNFGEANRLLLSVVGIPEGNVHRVLGESDPSVERKRYEEEILNQVAKNKAGVPEFDIVLLGMGSDGHTASIFPHEIELLQSENICDVATHPESGQKRITITGKVINAGRNVCFLITGAGKASVLAEIFESKPGFEQYPTSHIKPSSPATFYIDDAAAGQLAN